MWHLPLLLIMGVSGVYSGHSLRYYLTALSAPGHGLPEYTEVGYVDGIQVSNYNSDRGRAVPVAPWMEKAGPEYWKGQTKRGKIQEAVFKYNVRTAMERFNQTGGVHSAQVMYGCEMMENGSTRGYNQYGYDGRDFFFPDTERWVFTAVAPEAQVTVWRWNSPEERVGDTARNYLQTECIESLRKYVEYGQEELERKVPPKVKVSDHKLVGATMLHCHAYGFYPPDVNVYWKNNGARVPPEEANQVLPNTDGTYQIKVTVEVTPEDVDSYSCHVDHSGLAGPLIVMWDRRRARGSGTFYVIIGVIAAIAAGAVGYVLWRKNSVLENGDPSVVQLRTLLC